MKNIFQDKKRGFTLVEAMFGISIFIIIAIGLTFFARNLWIYNTYVTLGLSNVGAGQTAMKVMPAEIRIASSANDGSYAISQADATTFTFYADIYNNGIKEKIRYFLNGTSLERGITTPTGSPLSYANSPENISFLVRNVTSSSIFNYYDENYDGTTPSLPTPVDLASIRLVKISFTVDSDPNRPPPPFSFSTQVSIRNLKDNL